MKIKQDDFGKKLEKYFNASTTATTAQKLKDFPKYVPRQILTTFLVKYEIFKKILNFLDCQSLLILHQFLQVSQFRL